MKTGYYTAEEELPRKAIQVLMEKLGPLETFRFLSLPKEKGTESVKRHQQWQAELEQNSFFDDVFKIK